MGETPSIRWSSASRTDVGKIRKHNEDSLLDRADLGLWAVADGMGGHSAGDVASQMIVESLGRLERDDDLAVFVDRVEDAILDVNDRLLDIAGEKGANHTIGSTVAALIGNGRFCVFLWAGDSRIYRLRDDELVQLSQDHSQVEMYVEQGLMSRQDAGSHPAANMVTRAVGPNAELLIDMDMQAVEEGDRFLLCSDGLDKHVTDPEIQRILQQEDARGAVDRLVELTLERGAMDNVTVIIVDAGGAH